MATVYSLVAWGGRTGKTVTLSIASPCVASLTNHGLRDGTGIVFSTTGALPTGITDGTVYYTRSTATGTFNLYDTEAHAKDTANTTGRINTSGSQSGTHTAKSKRMLDLLTEYSGRWGASGSERCYDGLAAWNTGRSGASGLDVEYCEIGEAFVEYRSTQLSITVTSGKNIITATINNVRTPAFHNGVLDSAYRFRASNTDDTALNMLRIGDEIDGVDVHLAAAGYGTRRGLTIGQTCRIVKCLISSITNTYGIGVYLTGAKSEISNSLILNCNTGVICDPYQTYSVIDNNIVVKCGLNGIAFGTAGGLNGNLMYVRNNISLGNATNWATGATSLRNATNNLGLTGEAWITSGGTRLETTETAPFATIFADYDNNDFRPASASSPQVDTGAEYYGIASTDIADDERPNYNNGGAEAVDAGCYEFDHGYGPHPTTSTISLTNIVSGSRVLITRNDTSAVLYNDVPGTSLSLSTSYVGAFTVIIRKASASPYYREFTAGGTTVAEQTTTIQALQQLDE